MVKMIVGLGNPGEKYFETRHNVGFMLIDKMCKEQNLKFTTDKIFQAEIASTFFYGEKVYFVKPTTFMNESGKAVHALLSYYGLDIEDLVVIYDDLDIPIGALRIRTSGSSGTHNGMKSVVSQLGSRDFPRVRIGIGSNKDDNLIDFVIGKPSKSEEAVLSDTVSEAAHAVECYIADGIDKAMNRFNSGKVTK